MILDHGRDCHCAICECGRKLGRAINAAIEKSIEKATTPTRVMRDCRCSHCEALREQAKTTLSAEEAEFMESNWPCDVAQPVQASSFMPMTVHDMECLGGPRDGEKLAVQEGQQIVRVVLPLGPAQGGGSALSQPRMGAYAYDAARELLVWQGEA